MPTIRVLVEKWLDPPDAWVQPLSPNDAVATIRRLDAPSSGYSTKTATGQRIRQELVSVGMTGIRPIELDAGLYSIEALLPSGEVVSRDVSIGAMDQNVEVRLRGEYSPFEWMGWHHLMGNIPLQSQWIARYPSTASILPSLWQADFLRVPDSQGAQTDSIADVLDAILSNHAPGSELTDFFISRTTGVSAVPAWTVASGGHGAGPFTSLRFTPEGYFSGTRNYLLPSYGDHHWLAVLPVPWHPTDGSSPLATVDVLLGDLNSLDAGIAEPNSDPIVSIVVRDSQLATMIGYLAMGEADAAAAVLARAEGMLFDKLDNPIAAAAGGYVLMRDSLAMEDSKPRWFSWIENLMNLFPWLPDGAIQQGWLHLVLNDSARARDCFLDAWRRGLPYYSLGLRILHDGLTLLSNGSRESSRTPDTEVEAALASVRRMALSVDRSQAFTVIRLPDSSIT